MDEVLKDPANARAVLTVSVANLIVLLGIFIASWNWHFETFVTVAQAKDISHAEAEALEAADRKLGLQVEANTQLLQTHITDFKDYRRTQDLTRVQSLINDTNDKLYVLRQFPNDERRQAQERELRSRLASYELQKECLLRGGRACG